MDNIDILILNLMETSDLDWFKSFCQLLRRDQKPTVKTISKILGVEKLNEENEIRGSKFITTFDKRFNSCYINPDIDIEYPDLPIDYLGFNGATFRLKLLDIIDRFPNYQTKINTYDGGTQFFFYPVSEIFAFTAIDFWASENLIESQNLSNVNFDNLKFHFGNTLVNKRDGFNMR